VPNNLIRVLTLALACWATAGAAAAPGDFEQEMQAIAREIAQKHGLEPQPIQALLSKAEFRPDILETIRRPYEAKPWYEYRELFVTPSRTEQGVEFWRANEALLQRAQQQYGVPPEIIVAILGVETRYGRNLGGNRVLDALATLTFGYPERSAFFRRQLEEFVLLLQEEHLASDQVKGSYAGAIGKPQFMPSSYRNFAVDFDGDGTRDLVDSTADAIGSVANYFQRHGWQAGGPVAVPAQVSGKGYRIYVNWDMKPNVSVAELQQAGVTSQQPLAPETETTLLQLDAGNAEEHWLGFHNFYVITLYNNSMLYAMAVYQLSQEIRAQHQQHTLGKTGD
jgi:membrane-bound lytic murein transglycosylase B